MTGGVMGTGLTPRATKTSSKTCRQPAAAAAAALRSTSVGRLRRRLRHRCRATCASSAISIATSREQVAPVARPRRRAPRWDGKMLCILSWLRVCPPGGVQGQGSQAAQEVEPARQHAGQGRVATECVRSMVVGWVGGLGWRGKRGRRGMSGLTSGTCNAAMQRRVIAWARLQLGKGCRGQDR